MTCGPLPGADLGAEVDVALPLRVGVRLAAAATSVDEVIPQPRCCRPSVSAVEFDTAI